MGQHYVVSLLDITARQAGLVGGKGAHLGELSRVEGIRVPPGFCVTTQSFRRMLAASPTIRDGIGELARLDPGEKDAIDRLSATLRRAFAATRIPADLERAITAGLARLGEHHGYAVRSSATAEDLPAASFAGQHGTFLNAVGRNQVLRHVGQCWASLFSDRAVAYRRRNGVDHDSVAMAVVVQQMVRAEVSGMLFTADPATGNRRVASVAAGFGLGEAMVSGAVDADEFQVRAGELVSRRIGSKQHAVIAVPAGGTQVEPVDPPRRRQQALTDAQVLRLAELGRRIEAHLGTPQDIEWCLAGDEFFVVQSRPITTLFPVPDTGDDDPHVFISVGHQQMMTDAMKPLGWSLFQLTAGRPMFEAAGRLFVDVTRELAAPAVRTGLLEMIGRSDPLIADALTTIVDRGDIAPSSGPAGGQGGNGSAGGAAGPADTALVEALIRRTDESVAAMERDVATKSGPDLFEFILEDLAALRRLLFDPDSHRAVMAGMQAMWWLTDHLREWLGERNAADLLTRSAPHNVTAEMGLALLDVADVIRPHPQVLAFLRGVQHGDFLAELDGLAGGRDARAAIEAWLGQYGMRCVGEIDVTRPRWREQPAPLLPVILGHVEHFEPGESGRRFDQGRREALRQQHEFLARLRAMPDGGPKAAETERMIEQLRTFIGYREYPKYGMIRRYSAYKQALLAEAERLVRKGVIEERDDIFWLTFPELFEVVRTNRADQQLIRSRRDAFRWYESLDPPRVLTSDGEVVTGSYRRDDVPADALAGLPVSAGTVEGRARVVSDLAQADLEPGDILVTTHTDPSWTPLFVTVAGLVTEVGGLMTHGAVIAREYGLPCVVGVVAATERIADGQRIRVHGTAGYVELLPDEAE